MDNTTTLPLGILSVEAGRALERACDGTTYLNIRVGLGTVPGPAYLSEVYSEHPDATPELLAAFAVSELAHRLADATAAAADTLAR